MCSRPTVTHADHSGIHTVTPHHCATSCTRCVPPLFQLSLSWVTPPSESLFSYLFNSGSDSQTRSYSSTTEFGSWVVELNPYLMHPYLRIQHSVRTRFTFTLLAFCFQYFHQHIHTLSFAYSHSAELLVFKLYPLLAPRRSRSRRTTRRPQFVKRNRSSFHCLSCQIDR